MMTLDLTVRASTYGKPPADLAARVNEFTKRERLRRGARAFLPFFGAGCGLLLVPPHIALAPALDDRRGSCSGGGATGSEREFVSLTGACPDCGKPEPVDLPEALPAIQRCKGCGSFLKLTLGDG